MGWVGAAKDVDRFEGTQWEADIQGIRDEVLKTGALSDRHGYFENMLRMDLRDMKKTISSAQTAHKKVGADVDNKLTLRIGWLQKLVPLQQAFEEELDKKKNAKKRSYGEADASAFDFDQDVAAASQEEQLKDRKMKEQNRWERDKGWSKFTFKEALSHPARPGGLFGASAQRSNVEPGVRGRVMVERAERARAGPGNVFEQSAQHPLRSVRRREGERSDLNRVRTAPPAEVLRAPLAPRSRVPESEKDGEWKPSFAAAADSSPPLRTSARKAARGAECIEILSDDEEAEDAGPSGAIVIGDDDIPKHSTRPTRSSVKLSIPQRIGIIKVIFPHTPTGDSVSASTSSIGTVEMSSKDLLTLEDHEFLNDSVIEFFIKSLQHKLSSEKAARCHIFNSFFYEKLTNVRDERSEPADIRQKKAHQRVEKWTKGVNIFEKDFVFFPIHGNTHWSLMVLCHPGRVQDDNTEDGGDMPLGTRPTPYLLHMDSMSGGHKSSVVAMKIREYLAMEWLRLKPDTVAAREEGQATLLRFDKVSLPHQRMKVPQQDNGCDCGVFLCMFFEKFLNDLPKVISSQDVQAAVRGDAPPYSSRLEKGFLRREWFLPEAALVTRSELMLKILNELERGVTDLDVAREQGVDDKTLTALRNRLFNIKTVKDELNARVSARAGLVWEMIAARKRKKTEEETRKKREVREREARREARREGHVAFAGRSDVSGRATTNADGGGPAGATAFYGGAPSAGWGAPARVARRESDELGVESTTTQGSDGAARVSTRGKFLGGIPPRDAKPSANAEEGAESDDEDFQIKLPSPEASPSRSPARKGEAPVIDVSRDPVENERLLSESESEEIRATQPSPPLSPLRTRQRRDGGDGLGMKTAAAGAQAAFSEIERKRDKRTGTGGVLRLTRGKINRHAELDIDLTSGSGHLDDGA